MSRISKSEYLKLLDNLSCNIEEFIEYYKNNGNKNVCDKYQIKLCTLYKIIKDLNIQLTLEESKHRNLIASQQTCLERYGVTNVFLLPEFQEHCRDQVEAIYGVRDIFQRKDIIEESLMRKYGVKHNSQLESTITKRKETWRKNYGEDVDNPAKAQCIRAKMSEISKKNGAERAIKAKETKRIRYGDERYNNSEKRVQTTLERYNVPYYCMTLKCREGSRNSNNLSQPNLKFKKLLDDSNIEYITEFAIDRYLYDFKINNYLIEINPSATHNINWSPYEKGKPKDKFYHWNKSYVAKKHGFCCIHIFDWDSESMIIENIKNNMMYVNSLGEPRQFIYNYKSKTLVNSFEDNCIVIFDDGGGFWNGNN